MKGEMEQKKGKKEQKEKNERNKSDQKMVKCFQIALTFKYEI